MTPKQVERIKTKIKRIKAELAADKKHWGGYYHGGRGLWYLPPALYVQIADYTGGLRYINWFEKHFPDDSAYAKFFFECAIILFKTFFTNNLSPVASRHPPIGGLLGVF